MKWLQISLVIAIGLTLHVLAIIWLPFVSELKYLNVSTGNVEGETIFMGWSISNHSYGQEIVELPALSIPETGRYILSHRITNLCGWQFKRAEHGLMSIELEEWQNQANRAWLKENKSKFMIKEEDETQQINANREPATRAP